MLEKLKGTFDKSVESSRTRTAMNAAQKNMDAGIAALGAKLYNSWLAGSVDMTELEAECRKIQEFQTEVQNLQARLEQIKAEESQLLGAKKVEAVFCSNCGKKLDAGARFCDECGTAVK